jgi:diacylglycerol O-acyltransferase / wax synthase
VVMPQPGSDGKRSWDLAKNIQLLGPKTMFNVAITNQRSYAARSISLAESKQIGKRLGVSLNDVVLATCGGALRRYLSEYNQLPKKPLTAAVPVSLREEGNTDANNQVSMTVMTLATDIEDPITRLEVIRESSSAAKSLMGSIKAAIPTDFPSFGAPWLISGLASMYGRSGLANSLPPVANVAVSNVPGAQMPLYVAGAKMLTYFPVSIPMHGVALNMTVQSYNGSLEYGLIACRRAVPDIDDLGDFLVDEHRTLLALAMKEAPVAAHAGAAATDAHTAAHAADQIAAVAAGQARKTKATPSKKVASKKAVSKKTDGAVPAKRTLPRKPVRSAARKPRTSANPVH